jgi:hypothetical protein
VRRSPDVQEPNGIVKMQGAVECARDVGTKRMC